MTKVSIIIPAYKRIGQTLTTIDLILKSKGFGQIFDPEIIVVDNTGTAMKRSLQRWFGSQIKYTTPKKNGVASAKNHGARIAGSEIIIFCDSDMEVELDTILNTIKSLEKNKTAGAVGGKVIWKSRGKVNNTVDRPRPEDRRRRIGQTTYIEALYSRYLATYKKVFWKVGGYDSEVFNMRGEGSDLSIRYWRTGFPLVYDSKIRVHHVHDAPDSIALRVASPEWGVAKDYLLLAYKYSMLDGTEKYQNFIKTVADNFKQFGSKAPHNFLQGIANNFDFIVKVKPIIDLQKKKLKGQYDFKFLEIFSEEKLFLECIKRAEQVLKEIKKNV